MTRSPKLPLVHARRKSEQRDVVAGCHVCSSSSARWTKPNAQAVAAQHHDRYGHATWFRIIVEGQYGNTAPDPRQIDIEDAIASASSGDAPVCAPFPDLDAPAVTAADVSKPQGRPVETRGSKARAARGRKPESLHA